MGWSLRAGAVPRAQMRGKARTRIEKQRGVHWHATAKPSFGGAGAFVAQRSQGGRTWILPREPLDHRGNEGHRRRRDGGRDGGHGHRALTFARLGPRRREGRAAPRRNHKANAKGVAPGRGAEHHGARCPLGAPCARRCRRNSRPQRMPPGQATLVPCCPGHKGKKA